MTVKTAIFGKEKKPVGIAPAIAMVNPRYRHNVGAAVRAASCYGVEQVWWTGDRVSLESTEGSKKPRLGREERMKGYKDVTLCNFDFFFEQFGKDVTPIAVELSPHAENLMLFEHPEKPLYVFGPEDGGLTKMHRLHCHRHLMIPSRHCLNLGAAIYTVLYDRAFKRCRDGIDEYPANCDMLNEDRGWGEPVEI